MNTEHFEKPQNHDLHHEFPEYGDRIHALKISDAHFSRLFNEYDQLTHQIRRIELGGSLIGDTEMEKLKMDRVHLKDKLYAYISKPA